MPMSLNTAARFRRRIPRGTSILPYLWLMTDVVRVPDPVAAIGRLPRGSGVIIRHTDRSGLRALAERLLPLCRQKHLMCLIAGDWRLAADLRAHGVHLSEHMARSGNLAGA